MAITKVIWGIIGMFIPYCWIELAMHPQEIWRYEEKRIEQEKDKRYMDLVIKETKETS